MHPIRSDTFLCLSLCASGSVPSAHAVFAECLSILIALFPHNAVRFSWYLPPNVSQYTHTYIHTPAITPCLRQRLFPISTQGSKSGVVMHASVSACSVTAVSAALPGTLSVADICLAQKIGMLQRAHICCDITQNAHPNRDLIRLIASIITLMQCPKLPGLKMSPALATGHCSPLSMML